MEQQKQKRSIIWVDLIDKNLKTKLEATARKNGFKTSGLVRKILVDFFERKGKN